MIVLIDDDEDVDFLNFIACKRSPKLATLKDLSNTEFLSKCCWANNSTNNKLSTCSHKIKCFVKYLTSGLKQVKLNWVQDLVIANDSGDELDVYIGNEPLND